MRNLLFVKKKLFSNHLNVSQICERLVVRYISFLILSVYKGIFFVRGLPKINRRTKLTERLEASIDNLKRQLIRLRSSWCREKSLLYFHPPEEGIHHRSWTLAWRNARASNPISWSRISAGVNPRAYMREGPWPNKSSRKESNLHYGISRAARKQGTDNGAPLDRPSRHFVPAFTTHPRHLRCALLGSGRREIKRIRKFKSLARCATSPGRRGPSEESYGGRAAWPLFGRIDTIWSFTPPFRPHGIDEMEIREIAREGCRFADDYRACPIRPENAGQLCVHLRIAWSRLLSLL